MAEASSEPVKTFSIGFTTSRPEFNELPYARAVAKTFGTDHHEEIVEPDVAAMLPRVVRAFGEPFADPTALPTFRLSEITRRHVTVALSGDGGDEAFAGYDRYAANVLLARLPAAVRRGLARLGAHVPPNPTINSTQSRLRRLAGGLPLDPAGRYLGYMTHLDTGVDRTAVYTPEGRAQVGETWVENAVRTAWEDAGADELLDRMLATDLRVVLARRSAGEGGHRLDALFTGGSLSAARSRADGARCVGAPRAQAPWAGKESRLPGRAAWMGARRDSRSPQTGLRVADR